MITACGVDIGSNSFRLLVAEVENGRLRPLFHDLVTVRLGEGLGASGLLAPAAMARAETALARFAGKIAEFPVRSVRVCATHAVRNARNNSEFLQRIESRTGIRIEVISGEEEARLALLGALSALTEKRRYPLLLADVGGGSTEIIFQATAASDPRQISLPLGALGLTEEFGAGYEAMRSKLRTDLVPALRSVTGSEMIGQGLLLVASGGTATTLAALALGLTTYDARQVQNYLLTRQESARLLVRLTALAPGERNRVPGLGDGRGEIVVAGAVILQELQEILDTPSLVVSDAGLLEGILLSGATCC